MKSITEKELKKIIEDLKTATEQTRIMIVAKEQATQSTDMFERYGKYFDKNAIGRPESFDYHIDGLHLVSFRCQDRAKHYIDPNVIGSGDGFYSKVYTI